MLEKLILLFVLSLPFGLSAQQVSDSTFNPSIQNPAYQKGTGPIVFIDEGHHNFHTKNGRYRAFAELLEKDGYVLETYGDVFERQSLSKGKILVISNALHESNLGNWTVPCPSAFTDLEIDEIEDWVKEGGSLFLIADHMPMGGAAKALAARFGFEFTNGFAMDTISKGHERFNLTNQTLSESKITKGRNASEDVSEVISFTGQAFKIPSDATPILTFGPNYINLMPDTAWAFDNQTKSQNVEGWSQGAFKTHGKGKVVAFGEAAMFTAQLAGQQKHKVGMNNPEAKENYQLLLNIIHWLDGMLD